MATIFIFLLLALVAKDINTQETCTAAQAIDDFKLLLDVVNNQTNQIERQKLYHERYQIFIMKIRECPKLSYKAGSLNPMKLLDVVWGALMVRGQVVAQCLGGITSYTMSLLFQSVVHILYEGLYSIVHVLIFGLQVNFHIDGFENKYDTSIISSCVAVDDGFGAILGPKESDNMKIDTNLPVKYTQNSEKSYKVGDSIRAIPGLVYLLPNTMFPKSFNMLPQDVNRAIQQGINAIEPPQFTPQTNNMMENSVPIKPAVKANPDAVADNIANMISVMDKEVPVINNSAGLSELTPGVDFDNLNRPLVSSVRSGVEKDIAPPSELTARVGLENLNPPLVSSIRSGVERDTPVVNNAAATSDLNPSLISQIGSVVEKDAPVVNNIAAVPELTPAVDLANSNPSLAYSIRPGVEKEVPVINNASGLSELTPVVDLANLNPPLVTSIITGVETDIPVINNAAVISQLKTDADLANLNPPFDTSIKSVGDKEVSLMNNAAVPSELTPVVDSANLNPPMVNSVSSLENKDVPLANNAASLSEFTPGVDLTNLNPPLVIKSVDGNEKPAVNNLAVLSELTPGVDLAHLNPPLVSPVGSVVEKEGAALSELTPGVDLANLNSPVVGNLVPAVNSEAGLPKLTPGIDLATLNTPSVNSNTNGVPLVQNSELGTGVPLATNVANEQATLVPNNEIPPEIINSIPSVDPTSAKDLNNVQNMNPSEDLNTNSITPSNIEPVAETTSTEVPTTAKPKKHVADPWWRGFWKLFG